MFLDEEKLLKVIQSCYGIYYLGFNREGEYAVLSSEEKWEIDTWEYTEQLPQVCYTDIKTMENFCLYYSDVTCTVSYEEFCEKYSQAYEQYLQEVAKEELNTFLFFLEQEYRVEVCLR